MDRENTAIKMQVSRQIAHWSMAADRLYHLNELAAPQAWESLEQYLNTTLQQSLKQSVNQLKGEARIMEQKLKMANNFEQYEQLQKEVDRFRKRYLRTETTIDFYVDAINSRTNINLAKMLSACDRMATSSMKVILEPLGKPTPPVLTYIDKGLGASILKAGLRLWDGRTQSPAAAIKIVRHNLYRPTALIHEAGHQVAHILGWNEELTELLEEKLGPYHRELGEVWASWSSEIAADTFAFAHTGFAAVAGLHDVVSGNDRFVFRFLPGDPHPISYIRVLLGIEMCKLCFGKGPWLAMEKAWKQKHDIENASTETTKILRHSLRVLPKIAAFCLQIPLKSFGGKALSYWINPKKVQPEILNQLNWQAGNALFKSSYWIEKEPIRLLALNGYQIAVQPNKATELLEQQRQWMIRLGDHKKYYNNFIKA